MLLESPELKGRGCLSSGQVQSYDLDREGKELHGYNDGTSDDINRILILLKLC